MARSWEYSRNRWLAMQVLMWLIFAGTLGLAAVISHHRQQGREVVLSGVVQQQRLLFRLPAGWSYNLNRDGDKAVATAIEPGHQRKFRRVVQISQEVRQGAAPSPEDYLAEQLPNIQFKPQPCTFAGLHAQGIWVQIPPPDEEEDQFVESDVAPGLYACAVLSLSNGSSLAVQVNLEDLPPFDPDDEDLFQQLIDSISLAPANQTSRLDTPDDEPVRVRSLGRQFQ